MGDIAGSIIRWGLLGQTKGDRLAFNFNSGAILIASNASIAINGQIVCEGGDGGDPLASPPAGFNSYAGGAGEAGAIRLLAPGVSGGGKLRANNSINNDYTGRGRIRGRNEG